MSKLKRTDFNYISCQSTLNLMEECGRIGNLKPRGDNKEIQLDYAIYDLLEYIDKNLTAHLVVDNEESQPLDSNLASKWFSKSWNRNSSDPADIFLTAIEKRVETTTITEDVQRDALFDVLAIIDSCPANQNFRIQLYDRARIPLDDLFHELLRDSIDIYAERSKKSLQKN